MATTMLKEKTDNRTARQQLVNKFVETMKNLPKITSIAEVRDDGYNVIIYYTCSTFLMEEDLLQLQRVINPKAETHDPIRIVGYRGDYSLTTKIGTPNTHLS